MDKKHATFRIEPAIMKRLKLIAVEHDKTLTELFLEGIEYLLKKYEKPLKK